MLFRQDFLARIQTGAITLAFRRWQRPTVRSNGTLLTGVGQLQIGSVAAIGIESITVADAQKAGYATLEALLEELNARPSGLVYRVELRSLNPDPRVALRASTLNAADTAKLTARLDRMDRLSRSGSWTRQTLEIIWKQPGRRAGDLCVTLGLDKDQFKINVRKLKTLGLTESLEVGYRLSPRGLAYLSQPHTDAT